jgi:hypothetical protein
MKMPGCALAALLLISCNSHAGGRSIPQLVNQARAEARKWQPDAQLVQIEVSDFGFALGPSGIPDITKAGPPGTVLFNFISPSAHEAARIIAQPKLTPDQLKFLQDRGVGAMRLEHLPTPYSPYTLPIPETNIDPESAIAKAKRDIGAECAGTTAAAPSCSLVQSAELHMYSVGEGGTGKPVWKISFGQNPKTFEPVTREVDAASGELVALNDMQRGPINPANRSAQTLDAYVPVPAVDRAGRAVTDPRTGLQITDGFCIMWNSDWLTRNDHVAVTVNRVWWDGLSYQVNPIGQSVTVYRVWGPNVVATAQGPRPAVPPVRGAPQEIALDENATAPMFNRPQPGWPCTQQTWGSIRDHYIEWTRMTSAPSGGSGGNIPPWERIEGDRCAHSADVRKYMGCPW